jgi:hypothetical protein
MTTVTDADRKAAEELTFGLDLGGWSRGYGYFSQHVVQAFARHREAAEARARLEGAEIMREAAARDLRTSAALAGPGPYKGLATPIRIECLRDAADLLDTLDPAAILEAHTRAKAMDELIAGDGDTL